MVHPDAFIAPRYLGLDDGRKLLFPQTLIKADLEARNIELLAKKNLGNDISPIDFSNPRIICLAQEYSIDDKCLALALGAELWKYRVYKNNILMIIREEEPEQLIKSSHGKPTIVKIKRQPRPPKTIEQHLKGASDELKQLFNVLDTKIIDISSEVEKYTTRTEIIYKTSLNFAYLAIQNKKNGIRCFLRTGHDKIKDPKKLTTRIPKTHRYGNITRIVFISPKDIHDGKYDMEDILDLLEQSYKSTQ